MAAPDADGMHCVWAFARHIDSVRKQDTNGTKSTLLSQDPLEELVNATKAKYAEANPRSLEAHKEACRDFPGGNTRTVLHTMPFPLTFTTGKGCELRSLDGDAYIDFLGEYTAGIYGHSNATISAAVQQAMKKGWNFGGPNPYERELARKITQRFSPSGVELVRFTNSGTEANTMAIAAAVAFTKRPTILVFSNGYHGGTLSFPSTLSKTSVNLPHHFVIAPFNDIAGTQRILKSLPKDSLAAILVEPIQGSGGCIVGSQDFLHFLNEETRRLGALFIVDEVMVSRLSYHGYSSSLGLTPDLVTMGKWIGGGMTFGAFGGRKDGGIMSMFDPNNGILTHSGTFNNNIVTMAAGCAGMDIYSEERVDQLNQLGEGLRASVEALLQKHGVPGSCHNMHMDLDSPSNGQTNKSSTQKPLPRMWVSGKGSMMNIHFSGRSEKSWRALLWHHMLQNGIYMAPRGLIALNLELKKEYIEKFLRALDVFVLAFKQAQDCFSYT